MCNIFQINFHQLDLEKKDIVTGKKSVLIEHNEYCLTHQDSQLTYLCQRQGLGLIHQLEEQIKRERDYWHHLLQQIVPVTCALAELCWEKQCIKLIEDNL